MSRSPKDILPLTHRPVGDENQHYVDHPEPELLATSVGKEVDGRLIPSSSTISLLSLNQSPSLRTQQQLLTQIYNIYRECNLTITRK